MISMLGHHPATPSPSVSVNGRSAARRSAIHDAATDQSHRELLLRLT
ncbi:hypothetical protein ACPA9J_07895 [Pseudomonas aeruginosa]